MRWHDNAWLDNWITDMPHRRRYCKTVWINILVGAHFWCAPFPGLKFVLCKSHEATVAILSMYLCLLWMLHAHATRYVYCELSQWMRALRISIFVRVLYECARLATGWGSFFLCFLLVLLVIHRSIWLHILVVRHHVLHGSSAYQHGIKDEIVLTDISITSILVIHRGTLQAANWWYNAWIH